MRPAYRLRQVVNLVNLSTPLGLLVGRAVLDVVLARVRLVGRLGFE